MTFLSFIRAITIVLSMVHSATAEEAKTSFKFNLLEYKGLYVSKVFTFDENCSKKFGIPIKLPFKVSVPTRKDIKIIADGKPEGGGIVKFTFYIENQAEKILVENIQIINATLPIPQIAEDNTLLRIQMAAKLLRESLFASYTKKYTNSKILSVEKYEFKNNLGVELIGRYTGLSGDPMLLRATAHLNPNYAESLITIANINLNLVPVKNNVTLRKSITAKIANSLTISQLKPIKH